MSKNTVQSSHPFRVIDNDGISIHSMQSLGRVGRILSGSLDPPSTNANVAQVAQKENQTSQQSESPTPAVSKSPSNASIPAASLGSQKKTEDSQSQNSNYSLTMNPNTILQEPDVIASTKLAHSKTTDSVSCRVLRFL